MSRNAQRVAQTRFGIERQAETVERFYTRLLGS